MTQTSRDQVADLRKRSVVLSGSAVERAQKVFDAVLKSGLVFKRRSVRLTVFDGPLEFPIFKSDTELAIETGALKKWVKNAQLAALFIDADLHQDFLSSPTNVATYATDRSVVDMGFDLTAADLLAKIGYDPRAMRDVRRARVDVSEQQILSIESKLKSIGYQV